MKIVVAIKQVPARGALLDASEYEINEPDAYALEAGLQLREKSGGEVVVVSAGPARVASTIREALAKGADRAIHIVQQDEATGGDPLSTARSIANALESEKPDLILTGLQSDDFGYGQTGVILAELMGLPHATIIMSVEVQGASLRLKRELENGYFQQVEMPLPALLTMQSGSNKLRYATLMGIKKAKTKEIRTLAAMGSSTSIKVERIYMPERSKQSQMFDGPPREAAAKLVEKLKFEARVL